jgi:hypothetical protein
MDMAGKMAMTFKCERGVGNTHKKLAACASGNYRPTLALVGASIEMRDTLKLYGLTLDILTGKIKEEFRKEFVEDILAQDVEWVASGEVKVQIVPMGQFSVDRTKDELLRTLKCDITHMFESLNSFGSVDLN